MKKRSMNKIYFHKYVNNLNFIEFLPPLKLGFSENEQNAYMGREEKLELKIKDLIIVKKNRLKSAQRLKLRSERKIHTANNLLRYINFFGLQISGAFLPQNFSYIPTTFGINTAFPVYFPTVNVRFDTYNFLRPRWYRLSRLSSFCKYLYNSYENALSIRNFSEDLYFISNVKKKQSFSFFFEFFIRKRWFLVEILNR